MLFRSLIHNNLSFGNFCSGSVGQIVTYTPSPSTNLLMGSRIANIDFKGYRGSTLLGTNTNSPAGLPNFNFYFGARNTDGTAGFYLTHQHAFAFIGEGLSTTEQPTFQSIIQTFQTTLGRQI